MRKTTPTSSFFIDRIIEIHLQFCRFT